jgi:hypothetical protein
MREAAFGTKNKPQSSYAPIPQRDYSNAVRHLNFHLWPLRTTDGWKYHLDALAERWHLFNGYKVLSVATNENTVHIDKMFKALEKKGLLFDHTIHRKNDTRIGEVAFWVEKMQWLLDAALTGQNGVVFYAHSKGVRPQTSTRAIRHWTEVMYSSCLDYWPLVEQLLNTHLFAGSLKRYGAYRYPGNFRWHYSGTFYWFRLLDILPRKPLLIERRYTGTEAFPGFKARTEEAGVLFEENLQHDPYRESSWTRYLLPQWKEWQEQHATSRTDYHGRLDVLNRGHRQSEADNVSPG